MCFLMCCVSNNAWEFTNSYPDDEGEIGMISGLSREDSRWFVSVIQIGYEWFRFSS
jgi:hypothetical protein